MLLILSAYDQRSNNLIGRKDFLEMDIEQTNKESGSFIPSHGLDHISVGLGRQPVDLPSFSIKCGSNVPPSLRFGVTGKCLSYDMG